MAETPRPRPIGPSAARRPYKPRPAGSLKAATAELLTAAGGTPKASEITGRSQSGLQRYGDPAEPARTMPTGTVLLLKRASGQPVVTRYLAAESGCLLLELGAAAGVTPVGAEVAKLGEEIAEVFAAAAEALADGRVEPAEAGRILGELDEALTAAMALRGHLAEIRGDGEAET